MPREEDLDYFTRRNRQEDEYAKESIEPSARRAHRELAKLHRAKAREALAKVVRISSAKAT